MFGPFRYQSIILRLMFPPYRVGGGQELRPKFLQAGSKEYNNLLTWEIISKMNDIRLLFQIYLLNSYTVYIQYCSLSNGK